MNTLKKIYRGFETLCKWVSVLLLFTMVTTIMLLPTSLFIYPLMIFVGEFWFVPFTMLHFVVSVGVTKKALERAAAKKLQTATA